MKQQLTQEQSEALVSWAHLYGRTWKQALRFAWMDGNYHGFTKSNYLQQIRNSFGPSWLVRVRVCVHCRGVNQCICDALNHIN